MAFAYFEVRQNNADQHMLTDKHDGSELENHLDYIHGTFFVNLEVIMEVVKEELKLFREKCKRILRCETKDT